MPINRDDIEQGNPPITSPEGDVEEQGQPAQEATEPESRPGWSWIGSPSRPEAKERSDGISDLFTVDDEDLDAGEGVDDLVEVDMERDIIDAGEDGTLEDLTSVTDDDIMGSEDYGQPQSGRRRIQPRPRRIIRYQPPTSMRRSG